jgi:hypothetical protein
MEERGSIGSSLPAVGGSAEYRLAHSGRGGRRSLYHGAGTAEVDGGFGGVCSRNCVDGRGIVCGAGCALPGSRRLRSGRTCRQGARHASRLPPRQLWEDGDAGGMAPARPRCDLSLRSRIDGSPTLLAVHRKGLEAGLGARYAWGADGLTVVWPRDRPEDRRHRDSEDHPPGRGSHVQPRRPRPQVCSQHHFKEEMI